MDPAEILTVRFHFGGEFVHIGKELDYVGGIEAISEIERDKLSLQEVLGFLKDHMEVKESMKLYFLHPGKELVNGLVFLYDDPGSLKMSEHTTDGGVADIYVEYHGEEDLVGVSSGTDFEDEVNVLADSDSDVSDVPEVMTAEDGESAPSTAFPASIGQLENVLVPDDYRAITQVMSSPGENVSGRRSFGQNYVRRDIDTGSQVINSSMQPQVENPVSPDIVLRDVDTHRTEEIGEEYSDSSEDSDYVPHSDDIGEESEVVDLRKKAKQFKTKMRASQRWVDGENATGAVPIDLVANVEEVLEEMNKESEFETSDEDYSYDEEEEGHIQAQTDAAKAATSSTAAASSIPAANPTKQFKPPRPATPKAPPAAPRAPSATPTAPSAPPRAPTAPTRSSPRRAPQAAASSSNQQSSTGPRRGRKRELLTGKFKGYFTASGNY